MQGPRKPVLSLRGPVRCNPNENPPPVLFARKMSLPASISGQPLAAARLMEPLRSKSALELTEDDSSRASITAG